MNSSKKRKIENISFETLLPSANNVINKIDKINILNIFKISQVEANITIDIDRLFINDDLMDIDNDIYKKN